jgi:hypothetical protein
LEALIAIAANPTVVAVVPRPQTAAAADGYAPTTASAFEIGAPRPMKTGTIASPWRYDCVADFAM